jgi:hypothetical protein
MQKTIPLPFKNPPTNSRAPKRPTKTSQMGLGVVVIPGFGTIL